MLEFNTSKNAESAAQTLQLYFFGWWQRNRFRVPIPQELITRALELLLYLLPHMKPFAEDYVRSKLDINSGPIDEGVRAAMHHVVAPQARSAVLEHHLRVVVNLLRNAPPLKSQPLAHVGTFLQPMWDYRSDAAQLSETP
jgi:hypothetical protein